jgi:hypothetical protein
VTPKHPFLDVSRIALLVAATVLCSQQGTAQTVSSVHGGETLPLNNGVLFILRGCIATAETSDHSEQEVLNILYAIPHVGRGGEHGGGGSNTHYTVTAAFRTRDGGMLVADTVVLSDGKRCHHN